MFRRLPPREWNEDADGRSGRYHQQSMSGRPPDVYRPERATVSTKGLWLLVFGAASMLYLLTAQRGVSWQDSGMFQWRVAVADYRGDLGLALAHPLYIAAGRALWWITGDNFPLALNAFSGVGMALAAANLAGLIAWLTERRWIGLAVAGMVTVAHTAWWLSTIAEVYTWSVAGLTAELWLLAALVRRPRWSLLAWLAMINGLGLCVHNFALLPLPVYVLFAAWMVRQRRLPAWSLAAAGAAWLLGAGLYLLFIAELAIESGSVRAAVGSALFGHAFRDTVLTLDAGAARWKENLALTTLNFASVLLPLAVFGWIRFGRVLARPLAVDRKSVV